MDTPHAAAGEGSRDRPAGLALPITLCWAGSRLWLILLYAALRLSGHGWIKPLADLPIAWDASHYLEIARQGYAYHPGLASVQNVAFFPLWPMLLRLLGWGVGGGVLPWAACLGASLLFLCALLLLARWMSAFAGRRQTLLTVALLAFFPTSLYFSLPYTESLFLLLSLAAFEAWGAGRWRWAALLCLLLGLTRSNGWLAGAAIFCGVWLDWKAGPFREATRAHLKAALLCLAGFLGTALYLGYCQFRFGDFMAPIKVQQAWGVRPFDFFPQYLKHLRLLVTAGPAAGMGVAVDGTWGLGVLALALLAWRRRAEKALPRSAALYGVLAAVFPLVMLGGEGVRSIVRYSSVAFPVWAALGALASRHRRLRALILFLWLAVMTYFTLRFYRGQWVE